MTFEEIDFMWQIANSINRLQPNRNAHLEGGGAAITVIELNLQDGKQAIFGNADDVWYGSRLDEIGQETDDVFETIVPSDATDAMGIAIGILNSIKGR